MGRPVATATVLVAVAAAVAAAPARAAAPQIVDSWISGVTSSGADVRATVNPNGLNTTARVEYLTVAAYEANLVANPPRDGFSGASKSPVASGQSLGAGSAPVPFSRRLAGLAAGTAYRYRVVATNADGTMSSPAATLTTPDGTEVVLPDDRGWEMVSPVDKNGGEIQGPGGNFGGGVVQASADGNSLTYTSASSFAGGLGAPGASQYLSRRGPTGWATENVTQPTLAGAYGPSPDGVPYQLFSADLARGLLVVPERCAAPPCPRHYALRQSGGGALFSSIQASDLAFAGSNPDLTQVVLSSQGNLHRFSGAGEAVVNFKPGEATPTAGATLGAQSGAISADGSRVYFSLEGSLYLRDATRTVQVDEALGGGAEFQVATADGAVAFITKAGHLYRYVVGGSPTDLTPGGGVEGVVGISPDASFVYYLTPAGLFLYRGGSATKVADAADASNYPPATGTARIASDGTIAFLSSQSLTAADTGGFSQVYLYSPSAGLACVSCNRTGARPLGPSTIPGASANGTSPAATRAYKPRALSLSGNRLFFESDDALVAIDTNDDSDVYQWEAQGAGDCARPGGCVALISSGRATEGAVFLDASADGDSAFFLTEESLVVGDPGVADVYVARVGGGFPAPPAPIACIADACQVVPSEPDDPGPATAAFRSEGNPPLSYPKKKQAKKNKAKRRKAGRKKAGGKRGGKRLTGKGGQR